MSSSLTDILPAQLQGISVLLSGFLALIGLVLWSAGIKVARLMLAVLLGAVLACAAIWILPSATGVAISTAGIVGLVAGIMTGAVAFRAVQGIALAICMAVAVSGAYYQWQYVPPRIPVVHIQTLSSPNGSQGLQTSDLESKLQSHSAERPAAAVAPPKSPASSDLADDAGIKGAINATINNFGQWWQAIPYLLRQSMLILGCGVAIVSMAIAWTVPQYTTWILTAGGGTLLLLFGSATVCGTYSPDHQNWVPGNMGGVWSRSGAMLVVFLLGLLIQRLLFWPGRRQKKEREKDNADKVSA